MKFKEYLNEALDLERHYQELEKNYKSLPRGKDRNVAQKQLQTFEKSISRASNLERRYTLKGITFDVRFHAMAREFFRNSYSETTWLKALTFLANEIRLNPNIKSKKYQIRSRSQKTNFIQIIDQRGQSYEVKIITVYESKWPSSYELIVTESTEVIFHEID